MNDQPKKLKFRIVTKTGGLIDMDMPPMPFPNLCMTIRADGCFRLDTLFIDYQNIESMFCFTEGEEPAMLKYVQPSKSMLN